MELTAGGFNKVMELDTNGDGKIEEGEVKLGSDSEGNDYSTINCVGCIIWNCLVTISCVVMPGTQTRQDNSLSM